MSDAKPSALVRMFAAIGPGIVVAGSVIGSGELINTPVQAAKFGFVLLWVVLLSCVIKYFLQVEIARYCLVKNCTTFQALNAIPGPKIAGASWVVLLYIVGYAAANLTIVGILGALGGLMHGIWPIAESPENSTRWWAFIMVVLSIALLWGGWYRQLEIMVMLLVGAFSVTVGVGVFLVQGTQYRISAAEIASGLTLSLGEPRAASAYAVVSLMGALGVAANELLMYPYWILEKGYARELGDPSSPGWVERTRQRIRLIWLDAGFSTLLATAVTAAFFLLGAAVLHGKGARPEGLGVVYQISDVFTESYGSWSKALFLTGAFATLFSTLVVVAAASGRMAADLFGVFGLMDRANTRAVHRCHQLVQSGWLLALFGLFLFMSSRPERHVQSGHYVLGATLTPLLMLCIAFLAFRTDRRVRMGTATAIALVSSILIILGCVGLGMWFQFFGEAAK